MRTKTILLATIMLVLFSLLIPSALGSWLVTDTENFESDTAGSDPSGFYTYTDSAWDYVFVNETDYRTSNHSYEINDTDGVSHWSWFNWTASTHDYFELYFKIDNSTHEEISLYIGHTAGVGNEVKIVGQQTYEPCVVYSNYTTTAWNITISNNTWWRIRWDFNYTTNEIQCRLYNNASVDQTASNDTWLSADPESGALNIADTTGLGIYGASGKPVQIWFDDLKIEELTYGSRMRDVADVPDWAPGLLITITILAFIILLWKDISQGIKKKEFDKDMGKRLIFYFVAIVFLGIALSLI